MSKTPTSFTDLNIGPLKAAAEFFGSDAEGGKEAVAADLLDSGISWEDYLAADVPQKPEGLVAPVEVKAPENVITSKPAEEVTVTAPTVVTAEAHPVLPQANYLIKMERDNPYFEFGKYKFTTNNPYNIMDAHDAQDILTKEEGFRQAFPDELQEYYS